MRHTITGRLCGYICPNVEEQLSNAEIRLYQPEHSGQELLEVATAATKQTARILDDEAVAAKEDRLIGKDETDEEGTFDVSVGENVEFDEAEYEGDALEIDVYLETVPGEAAPETEPIQIAITTLQPEWRKGENGAIFPWEYCFGRDFWCSVREHFGAYVICGRALQCADEAENVPEETRAGLEVRARDADIIQHEVLGSGTTDANGYFRIYYSRADFERVPTPFTPIELFGGPDLFFEVDDVDGDTIYAEEPSRGRQSDRENAGACEQVRLCVSLPPRDGDGDGTWPEPMFTHVGNYDIDTEIDANGYALAGGDTLAFTGVLPLIGVMPSGGAPTAKEYRFRIEDLSTGAVTTLDSSAIHSTRIGSLQYWAETSPGTWELEHEPYYLENSGAANNVSAGSNGWIEVPREDDLGSVGTPGSGAFVRDTGELVRFDSRTVLQEAFDLTTPAVHTAGDPLDASEKSTEHAFAITFETRDVGSTGSPRTDTLSRIVISNTRYEQLRHPSWASDRATLPGVVMLDIDEFVDAGNGCIALSDDLTARVTAYNPHINDVRVYIEGPGASQSRTWDETAIGADNELATTHAFNISSLQPCAYILWLNVSYDLTRGFGRIDDDQDHIGFCISESP